MSDVRTLGVMGFYWTPEQTHLYGGYVLIDQRGDALDFAWSGDLRVSKLKKILSSSRLVSNLIAHELAPCLLGQLEQRPAGLLVDSPDALGLNAGIPIGAVCVPTEPALDGLVRRALRGPTAYDLLAHAERTGDLDLLEGEVNALLALGVVPAIFDKIKAAIAEARAGVE